MERLSDCRQAMLRAQFSKASVGPFRSQLLANIVVQILP